jgi:hypothetical protein
VFSAILQVCCNLSNDDACHEAVRAINSMVSNASRLVHVGDHVFRSLIEQLDNVNLSKRLRERILDTLQSYARIFSAREPSIDWGQLLMRKIGDETAAQGKSIESRVDNDPTPSVLADTENGTDTKNGTGTVLER